MLEFNQEHKAADLSAIKSKVEKAKYTGKIMLCGITLSAALLLSGCKELKSTSNTSYYEQLGANAESNYPASAIIMENGNAMIVDLELYNNSGLINFKNDGRTLALYTLNGDRILADARSVKIVEGTDAHEKAETIAQSLISENGKVTCYDEVENYGRNR